MARRLGMVRRTRVLLTGLVLLVAGCGGGTAAPTVSSAPATSVAAVDPKLDQLTTDLVAKLVAEDFEAAVSSFNETMLDALPAEELAKAWEQVIGRVGSYRFELSRRQEATGGYQAVVTTAQFEQSALDLRVVFDADRRVAGLFFQPATPAQGAADWSAPAYVDMAAVSQSDVTIGRGEWELPGTLTTPMHGAPWPAVVLVHGSGPNDRDETIGPNKPFRDLALGLASRGVAVLAYDKRTLTHGTAMAGVEGLTVQEEVVDDAVLGVDLLRVTDGVDPDRVFVLGHSLGGMLAPRIAQESDGIAGLVIMAGAARPLEDLILEQSTHLAKRDGALTTQERGALDDLAEQVATIKDPALDPSTSPALLLDVPASYWLDLRGYRPPAAAADLGLPILVLQGERDYQVTMRDFERWDRALGGRDDAMLVSFPDLNHLMMGGPVKPSLGNGELGGPEEYRVPGHVAFDVLEAIASFILR